MYVCFNLKMVYPVEKSMERCGSNSLSRDNETLCYLLYSSFELLRKTYSREGDKVAVVLVT